MIYAYTGNDPLNKTDPTGLCAQTGCGNANPSTRLIPTQAAPAGTNSTVMQAPMAAQPGRSCVPAGCLASSGAQRPAGGIRSEQRASMLKRRILLRGVLSVPVVSVRANALGPQIAAGDDTGPATGPKGPSSEAIRAMLANQIDPGRQSLGYVACIIDADGRRLIPAGHSDAPDGRALDGDSVFEIGSITKVFTALLLAHMAQRGEVALDDPVAKYLLFLITVI
jgi:CubicO group peptidase (beta-lactamase class C family)